MPATTDSDLLVWRAVQVAMMFLTRGELHQEPVWDLWFRHAEGLIPVSALKVHGCGPTFLSHLREVCGHAAGDGPIQRQHLFNVYVHVGANEVNFTGAHALPPLITGYVQLFCADLPQTCMRSSHCVVPSVLSEEEGW